MLKRTPLIAECRFTVADKLASESHRTAAALTLHPLTHNSEIHILLCALAKTCWYWNTFAHMHPDYSRQSAHIIAISAHSSTLVSDNSSHIPEGERAMEPSTN